MQQEEIKFNPLSHMGPSYFISYANQKLTWLEVMAELIDNAWDAGANRVGIQFGPGRSLEVIDDGDGCDDIEKMLSLGVHYIPPGKKRHRIGRYGVGLKDSATWVGGITEIATCDGKFTIRGQINWAKYTSQDDPDLKFYRSPMEPGDFTGTIIRFRHIEKRMPDVPSLLKDIGYIFSPGLRGGKQIIAVHNKERQTCAAWKLPAFDNTVVNETFFINGRGLNLYAGVVRDGEVNEHKGYSLFYDNRIIKNTTTWANGGQSLARFCSVIELDNQWTLGKNKTEIKESEMDELEIEVYKRCQFLIERAKRKTETLKNSILNTEVSRLLQTNLEAGRQQNSDEGKREKERRDPGDTHGTIEPKHTDIKRKPRKKHETSGGKLGRVAAVIFDWEIGKKDGDLGRADIGKKQCIIWLNENHPYLAYLKEEENAEAIASVCWVIAVEQNQTVDGDQFRLISRGESVVGSLSKVLLGYEKATSKERARSA